MAERLVALMPDIVHVPGLAAHRAPALTALVGEPVMAYVTRWRMLVAHDRLRAGDTTVAAVAGAMGYRSEAAFGRAFRRVVGTSPCSVRPRARDKVELLGA